MDISFYNPHSSIIAVYIGNVRGFIMVGITYTEGVRKGIFKRFRKIQEEQEVCYQSTKKAGISGNQLIPGMCLQKQWIQRSPRTGISD